MRGELLDQAGRPLGRLEVVVSYDYLMQDILQEGWMVAQMACLVNDEGHYLAHSNPAMQGRHCLGETQDPLELAMLKAMKEKPYGTLMGEGYLPEHVIGYYKLAGRPLGHHAARPGQPDPGSYLAISILLPGGRHPVPGRHPGAHPPGGEAGGHGASAGLPPRPRRWPQGDYGEPLPVTSRDEIGQLTFSFNDMIAGLKERDFISNTFGRYVDQEIARELLSRPEASRMGGVKREVVILFADIRGFTPLAETLSPEATIHLVNRHFARMIEVIQAHRGIIVDFLGDAILAFFDPLDGPMEPVVQRAISCALKLQAGHGGRESGRTGATPLHMGIGLHAGEVVVGNIGSESRAKYGIIGAAVNLTHRIQGQAQGGEVVVSEMVFHHSQETLAVNRTFETTLKGIAHPVRLYVVESMGGET